MKISSISLFDGYGTLSAPKYPSSIMSWVGVVITNMVCDAQVSKEKEIEMAKILYEFIAINEHLFSNTVLAAANVLLEEIKKAEDEISKRV